MNLQKFNRNQSANILMHCNRSDPDRTYGNQEIKAEKTNLNYNLAPIHNISDYEFMKKRTIELKALKRKDVNTLCSWVITIPKELDKNKQKYFFKESYNFLESRYGRENVVSSYVHLDETSPHMHFAFVPAYYNKEKQKWTCNAKKLINRDELKIIHKEMQDYLQEKLKVEVNILNGVTESNKTVEELKKEKRLEDKAIELLKNEKEIREKAKDELMEDPKFNKIFLDEVTKDMTFTKEEAYRELERQNKYLQEKYENENRKSKFWISQYYKVLEIFAPLRKILPSFIKNYIDEKIEAEKLYLEEIENLTENSKYSEDIEDLVENIEEDKIE